MIPINIIALLRFLFSCVLVDQTSSFRSVCVYTNWAQYRGGRGQFVPENIDTALCTHILYAFAKPEGLDIRPLEWNDESNDWNVGMFARINKLKERSPDLKVVLSVGGRFSESKLFVKIGQTAASRTTFIYNAVAFLRRHNFDGLDIAREFLGTEPASDKVNFQLLIQDLKKYIDEEFKTNGRVHLMLSVTVPARKELIDNGLQVAKLANYTDFVNLRTFELDNIHGNYVDYNYPVYSQMKQSNDTDTRLTLHWAAQYYLSLGLPKEKINIGIATFARSYNLTNPSRHKLHSQSDGQGNSGNYTHRAGMLAYYEVCDMISEGAKNFYDRFHDGAYAVLDNQWVGFESIKTVTKKACYAKIHGFGGLMFYSLDLDDFTGSACRQGQYPLIKAAHNAMSNTTSATCSLFYIRKPGTDEATTKSDNASAGWHDRYLDNLHPTSKKYRIVCYYISSTQFPQSKDKLLPENVDTKMCTHISYNYADLIGLDLSLSDRNGTDAGSVEGRRIVNLKYKNPEIKILLAVKGSSIGSPSFLKLVKNVTSRSTFARNTALFLRERYFDGFDIRWEHLGDTVNIPSNVLYFQLLLEELKRTFDKESETSGKPRLLLSIALPARRDSIENGFDVVKINMCTDFISLQTFDFHGSWEKVVGFNSPLSAHPREHEAASLLNMDSFLGYYVSKEGDVSKLNIGIATYAVTFTLSDPRQHDVLSPATKPGRAGWITGTPGILAFYEVCELMNDGAEVVYVPSQHNKYLVKGDQWVGFEDKKSVNEKVCYAHELGVRGLMIYSLDFDDFTGKSCFQGKFPLLTTAYITLLDGLCSGSVAVLVNVCAAEVSTPE